MCATSPTGRTGKGERLTRPLFGRDGLISEQEAYRLIDETKPGRIFFKLIFSTDPKREDKYKDLDLQEITRKTLLTLEARLGRPVQFVGALHNDHTPIRHVHGIIVMQGKLSKEDFKALRETATQEARLQRRLLDVTREHAQFLFRSPERPRRHSRPAPNIRACPECGVIQKNAIACFNCGAPLHREFGSQGEEVRLTW